MITLVDNSEITRKVNNDDGSMYIEEINSFDKWCDDIYL